MQKLDVVTFGEAMAMFMADRPGPLHEAGRFTLGLAGAEANVAIGLARLNVRTGWVSKVGKDAFGKFIMKRLKNESVDISRVRMDDKHPTGFQLKSKVKEGDPEVQYFRKGSAASRWVPGDFDKAYFLKARHLHMTGIPLAVSGSFRSFARQALAFMKENGKTVSFDPNLRPSLWPSVHEMIRQVNQSAFQCDWVLPGIREGAVLTGSDKPGEIADFYLEKGVKLVVVKLGEEGAYYKTASEEGTVSGFKVRKVVDTVGAGDGFAAGLISGLLEGFAIREAVIRANAMGALAVQSPGDHDGYPTKTELDDYLEKNGEPRKE